MNYEKTGENWKLQMIITNLLPEEAARIQKITILDLTPKLQCSLMGTRLEFVPFPACP